MIVVGDASVFIALERINASHLLPALFGEVHVPDAVWREVFPDGSPETPPNWIVRHALDLPLPATSWPETLDDGEVEAIHLARQLAADLLLIDESTGRAVARRLGLEVTGVVGLLIDAKRRGKLVQVKPALDQLRRVGFWLSEAVYRAALEHAGEQAGA